VPRLRLVAHARSLAPDEDLAAALSDPAYDPAGAVLLPSSSDGADDGAAVADGTPAGEAVINGETPERIAIRVRAERSGFVVLADAYAPGWRAALDGRPVPVLRADGLFRAVAVSAGPHVLEMAYRPESVTAGLLMGACGLLVAGAWGLCA